MDFLGNVQNPTLTKRNTVAALTTGQLIVSAFTLHSSFWYDLQADGIDSSPSANDATLVNAPAFTAGGKPSNKVDLVAASTQYLTTALLTGPLSTGGNSFTVFGFANLASGGGQRRVMACGDVSTPASFEWSLHYNNATRFAFSVGNGVSVVTVTDNQVVVGLGTWYFVVGQYDAVSQVIRISVNRNPWVSTAFASAPLVGSNPVRVGNDTVGLSRLWDGSLDTCAGVGAFLSDTQLDYVFNTNAGRNWGAL